MNSEVLLKRLVQQHHVTTKHVLLQLAPFQFGRGAWEVTKIQTMMTFEDEDKPRYMMTYLYYTSRYLKMKMLICDDM